MIGSSVTEKNQLFNSAEAALYLSVTKKTLEGWRPLQKGPAYLSVDSGILYRRCDLDDWIRVHLVVPKFSAKLDGRTRAGRAAKAALAEKSESISNLEGGGACR